MSVRSVSSPVVAVDDDVLAPRTDWRRLVVVDNAVTLGLNGAPLVLNVVLALVLSRLLGASQYGAYPFALARVTLSAPARLGLGPLVVRHVAACGQTGRLGLFAACCGGAIRP